MIKKSTKYSTIVSIESVGACQIYTIIDKIEIEKLWNTKKAEWQVWND